MLDAQEKKRAEEWAKREQKIKDAMSRMADTVLKKSNEAEKELERRAVQYANQKDKQAEEREKAQKLAARNRDLEIRKTLDIQMEEKRRINELEKENNQRYVKMVIDRDEKDNQEMRHKNELALQRRIEIQKYQRLQMGELTQDDVSAGGGTTSIPMSIGGKRRHGNSKAKLGGPMHLEEIRMNKNLLKEISRIKKQGRTDRPGATDGSIQMEKNRESGLGQSSLQ